MLVAFKLAKQLEEAFSPGDPGKLVIKSRSAVAQRLGLDLPANVELVVLGDAGLRSLLGDESVSALRRLIDERQQPQGLVQFDPLQLTRCLRSTGLRMALY